MNSMFLGAESATPDTSGWNTSKVDHMRNMFRDALNATPDTSGWDTSKVKMFKNMFNGASNADPLAVGPLGHQNTELENIFRNSGISN